MLYKRTFQRGLVLLGLVAILLVLAACSQNQSQTSGATTTPEPAATSAPANGQTETDNTADTQPATSSSLTQSAAAGEVTIEITPLNLADTQAPTLDFQVTLDTHSVELDADLTQLAVLQVGASEVAATAWQAPESSGHHVAGTLSFPATDESGQRLLEDATTFSLVIRDLAEVAERTFSWDMNAVSGDVTAVATMPMTGTMPLAGQGMEQMAQMMAMMGDMSMAERQEMMGQMMTMMQQMMGQMAEMPAAEHQEMMSQMMDMMPGMMAMMADMPPEAQQELMTQMMGMMSQMIGMMGTTSTTDPTTAMPSMDMANDHMSPIPLASAPEATEQTGGQPLSFREEEGVKVFELTAVPIRWPILDAEGQQVVVTAWTYNGTVPGPMIRVTEGDKVRIIVQNDLPEATSIHWHGIPVPNDMDGVPPITQAAIQPGESFVYEFTAPPAGSFMYHSHVDTDRQVMAGLYAPFIVDSQEPEADPPAADVMWMLSEWRVGADGETYPAMPMAGAEPNYFTINGKAFPNTEPVVVKQGDRVRIRLAGIGQFTHPMHLHGMNFRIVAYDGVSLPPEQQIVRNVVPVNPGEVIDIEFIADNPGTWVFHCHVLHHVTNDNVEPGGLIGVIQVEE